VEPAELVERRLEQGNDRWLKGQVGLVGNRLGTQRAEMLQAGRGLGGGHVIVNHQRIAAASEGFRHMPAEPPLAAASDEGDFTSRHTGLLLYGKMNPRCS